MPTARRRTAPLLLLAVCSSALVAGCGTSPATANGTADVRPSDSGSAASTTAPASASASSPIASATTPSSTSSTGRTSAPVSSSKKTRSSTTGSTAPVARTGACTPTHVTVSTVGIDEPVSALGLDRLGQINPPPHTTMWYTGSPRPGADGISVIAGHVTYDGPDNFYNLDQVTVGSRVTLRCMDGAPLTLRVTHKESELKTAVQRDARVWGRSSTPVVVLITCDRNSPMKGLHHTNNYVVWTVPVS